MRGGDDRGGGGRSGRRGNHRRADSRALAPDRDLGGGPGLGAPAAWMPSVCDDMEAGGRSDGGGGPGDNDRGDGGCFDRRDNGTATRRWLRLHVACIVSECRVE